MKILKKIVIIFFVTIVIVILSVYIYLLTTKPQYDGELSLKNIQQETTVYFDNYGIPHIYAQSEKDAMIALGYVHAQDRLWQMELMRRIAPGRLSEIFGTTMLKNDKFFSGLGINEASEKAITQIDKNSEAYILTLAYLQGINEYIEKGKTPIEFNLLGIKKEKMTIKDVYNIFGFMSFSFAMAQKTDPLITAIRDQWGSEYLKDLGINGSLGTKQLKSYSGKVQDYTLIASSITSILEQSPVPSFIGSNGWVIGKEKTKNNKVIFANDPHILFSQPGTWYEAHIVTPTHEIYGHYLAGTPFPLLGHNRQYAYGLTMFENDDVDFFQEQPNPNNPNEYKTKQGYQKYNISVKTIKVKDSATVTMNIKNSVHGPIMSGLLDGLSSKNPIAMSWIFTQEKGQMLQAVYSLSHAKNFTQFHQGIALIHAPGLNVMYGDAQNNIAWIASGKLYKKSPTVNTNFILNGSNPVEEHKEFIDFKYNPRAINPPWHYVYSANNQPEAINGYLYPGYYLPKDRATRIDQLLLAKNNWTKNEVSQMVLDNTSVTTVPVVNNLTANIKQEVLNPTQKEAYTILKNWDGKNNLNSVAPTIFNRLFYHYLKNTFQDELGNDNFKIFLTTHVVKQTKDGQLANVNSPWWDNVNTKNKKETQSDILNAAFQQTIAQLQNQLGNKVSKWTWDKTHTLEIGHPIGKVKALRPFLNIGPFSVNGTNEVINNMMFNYNENPINEVKAGPSTRRIIDFSDIENSLGILPTGQSGNPMSKHYNDQSKLYIEGKYRKMNLNKDNIIKTSTKLVIIGAKP